MVAIWDPIVGWGRTDEMEDWREPSLRPGADRSFFEFVEFRIPFLLILAPGCGVVSEPMIFRYHFCLNDDDSVLILVNVQTRPELLLSSCLLGPA